MQNYRLSVCCECAYTHNNSISERMKTLSARDMSLSMGQNPGYVNNIESGKSMPSLSGIFYICEYLGIDPKDFFEMDSKNPTKLTEIIKDMKKLDDKQLDTISALVKGLIK